MAEGLRDDPRLAELGTFSRIEMVTQERLDALTRGTHQGVAAELVPRRYLPLPRLLDAAPRLLLALDSVLDPQNLGAILRSAEAAGVEGVILPAHRTAPLSPAAIKASSGASEHLAICRVAGLPSAISEVKRAGLWCAALDPRGEMAPWEFDLRQPVCLVVGGEGPGLHRLVRERCDVRLRLPMAGRLESLNVAAAAAVLLFEVVRQRAAGQ
jgi:23S rRNA (guanosine2251-2'-O)-methyltransferase